MPVKHRSVAATAARDDEAVRATVDHVPNDALECERRGASCDECVGMSGQVDVHLQGGLRSKDVTAQDSVHSRRVQLRVDSSQLDAQPPDRVLHDGVT
jgi:hypothetical protein